MIKVINEMGRRRKYRTFDQLTQKEKIAAWKDYQGYTDDSNTMEDAEYYYNNCGPLGDGGPVYFDTSGEPIWDEEASCYDW